MTEIELEDLERLAKDATRGPWEDYDGDLFFADKVSPAQEIKNNSYIRAANPAVVLELVQEARNAREYEEYIAELERDSRVYAKRIGEISELLDIEHDAGSLAELSHIFHSVVRLQKKLRQAQAERDFILEQVDDMFDADDLLRAAREASKND